MRKPSVAAIVGLGLSRQTAIAIRDKIDSVLNGRSVISDSRAEYLLNEIAGVIEQHGDKFTTHGVESIPEGHNKRSPGIYYLNAGETYSPTFMVVGGSSIRVGNWGSIVEAGHYD